MQGSPTTNAIPSFCVSLGRCAAPIKVASSISLQNQRFDRHVFVRKLWSAWQSSLDIITMPLPSNAAEVAEPPAVYIPFTNSNSPRQVKPTHEMPWPSEAGYRLLSDSEKAVSRPHRSATESHVKQTIESDNTYYSSKGIHKHQETYWPVLILWCSWPNKIRLLELVAAKPFWALNFKRSTHDL